MQEVQILKVDSSAGIAKSTTDLVAEETPLHIFLNKTHFVTILCTPSCLKEMAVGHMLSEGIIHHNNEIRSVILEEDKQLCRILFGSNTDIRKRIELAK
ncbi:MAG: formate dehydrogenase accessory sulfurtransferase FdhD, partial [Candidatus Bathyarchaeota archaeon]